MSVTHTRNRSGAILILCAVVASVVGAILLHRHQFIPKNAALLSMSASVTADGENVPIILDSGNQTINAAEVFIHFDPQIIQVESISKDNSIFQIWITDSPSFSNTTGEISLAGGLPNPGFKGRGTVGRLKLRLLKQGVAKLQFLSRSRVLLNDGKGTSVPLVQDDITLRGI